MNREKIFILVGRLNKNPEFLGTLLPGDNVALTSAAFETKNPSGISESV